MSGCVLDDIQMALTTSSSQSKSTEQQPTTKKEKIKLDIQEQITHDYILVTTLLESLE